MMNIQKLQSDLVRWGQYWYAKEMGAGFGSNSVTGRLCETLRTGIYSSGTAHQVADRADSIRPPEHILVIDNVLHILTVSELRAINKKYKREYKNEKHIKIVIASADLFTDRAENRLAGAL